MGGNIHSLYNNRMCKIQSFCTTIGSELSFIWTAGLAQHMYLLVSTTRKAAMRCSFIVLCSLTVLVIAENVYCYQTDILGGSPDLGMKWCWINVTSTGENCNWMLYNGKILEIVMYVAVFIYYSLLYTKVNHLKSRRDIISSSLVTHLSKTGKIVAIPFVFVLVRLWGTLVTLWLVVENCHRPAENTLFEMLLVMMSLFDLSQGWVNFVLYFLTTSSELRIMEKVKLVARSIPYMTKTRRQHSSENSCMTYNTSNGRRSHTPSSIHTRTATADSRTYSSSPVLANRTAVLFEQQDLAP